MRDRLALDGKSFGPQGGEEIAHDGDLFGAIQGQAGGLPVIRRPLDLISVDEAIREVVGADRDPPAGGTDANPPPVDGSASIAPWRLEYSVASITGKAPGSLLRGPAGSEVPAATKQSASSTATPRRTEMPIQRAVLIQSPLSDW